MPSVQPKWCTKLPLQQQSVLLLAARGPDGIAKAHPCKDIQRAYRATVLVAAKYNNLLDLEGNLEGDSFMTLHLFKYPLNWTLIIKEFFNHSDALPHHFLMHLIHGAEILGYKHPNKFFRERWMEFYIKACQELHITPETEEQMDERLSDWGQEFWEE